MVRTAAIALLVISACGRRGAAAAPTEHAAASTGVAPWALEYSDADEARDRAADAGHACTPGGPGVVDVRFEVASGAVLAIPALGVRDRLWARDPDSPSECTSDATGDVLQFHCNEDLVSMSGRAFREGNDLVVGLITPDGHIVHRYALPCGATIRFHAESSRDPFPP